MSDWARFRLTLSFDALRDRIWHWRWPFAIITQPDAMPLFGVAIVLLLQLSASFTTMMQVNAFPLDC